MGFGFAGALDHANLSWSSLRRRLPYDFHISSQLLVDCNAAYAVSDIAASSFAGRICAAGLLLAARRLCSRLGIHWARTLLGFLGNICAFLVSEI